MAEIIAEPSALSKIIPVSFKINDTDSVTTTRLATKKQFNTTDTDAWLSFTLDGIETTSGEFDLTLINVDENPSSIFHHTSIAFPGIPFHYKLDASEDLTKNEIRHAGRWIGQVIIRLANGDTTTRQFDFAIAGHLLDGKEARVILIEDYNALMATIAESKGMLDQYNIDYAALLADITEAETLRTQSYNQLLANQQANIEAFDVALDEGIVAANLAAKLQDFETTNNSRLLSAEQQLAEKAQNTSVINANLIGANKTLSEQKTIVDYFNRPNNVSVLGKDWEILLGTWGVIDGQAYVSTSAGLNRAVIDSQSSDGEAEVIIPKNIGLARLIFRATDISNEWVFYANNPAGEYVLSKRVGGTLTQKAVYVGTIADNAKLKVKFSGSSIKCFINGLKMIDISDTFNMTATKHGIGNGSSTETRFKNFKIRTAKTIIYPKTLIASVDNMLVDYKYNTLFLSRDGGRSYTESLPIPDVSIIKFVHLFSDGKIMFADHTKMYYSHDWKTYHESEVLQPDGSPFIPVVEYDNFTSYKNNAVKKILNGIEMAVWGNYSTVNGVDFTNFVKVWYTKDKGLTVKKAYSFNIEGSLSARHVHNVDFNPSDNTFWVQTGDAIYNAVEMSHWLKGTYDPTSDVWTWTEFASGENFRTTNMIFHSDGYVYWSWDKTPGGVVRAPYATLADVGTHQVLFITNKDCNNVFIGKNGDLVAFQTAWGGAEAARIMYYSPDRVTFYRIVGDMPTEFDDLTDAQYQAHWTPNAEGKILCGIQSLSQQNIRDWTRTPSVFVDDYIREYGFPNAFR